MQTLLGGGGNGNGGIPTCESINWFGKTYLSNDAADNVQLGLCHDRDELLYKEVAFERQESLPCDPDICRSMGRQICVDCTKCVHHCICDMLMMQQKQKRLHNDGCSSSTASSSLSCDEDEFIIEDTNSGDYSVNHRGIVKKNKKNSSRSNNGRRTHHDGAAPKNKNESFETRIITSSAQYGCDPSICRDERICGDCSRCSRHCDCAYEEEINSLVTDRQSLNSMPNSDYRTSRTSSLSTNNKNRNHRRDGNNNSDRSLTRSLSPTGGRYSNATNDYVRRQHIRKTHQGGTTRSKPFRIGKRNWR